MKPNENQLHRMVLSQRKMLIHDIEEHLREYRPKVVSCYSPPFLISVINDSIEIASKFNIDDVYSMRLFVQLRWDIAPGYFKQPKIAHVLAQTDRTAAERFEELTTDGFAEAWENALEYDGDQEWQLQSAGGDS